MKPLLTIPTLNEETVAPTAWRQIVDWTICRQSLDSLHLSTYLTKDRLLYPKICGHGAEKSTQSDKFDKIDIMTSFRLVD